ncbi:MAG: thioredoxin family protein, partial [Myxococcota bacterium]
AFDAAAAHVPREAAAAGVSAELVLAAAPLRPGDETRAALALVPAPGTAPLAGTGLGTFIPERHESLEVAVGAPAPHPRSPEGLIVPLTLTHGPDAPGEGGGRFGGVLTLHRNGETLHLRVDTALARGAADAARTPVASALFAAADVAEDSLGAATEESPGLALMLLFAFLGGLLLNLMPCVLPVLALKVVGLVELGGAADRQARAAAFGYVTGVVGSLLALGVLVAALAAAGRAVGWGFQLQEPVAVTLLMSALVVFALHLFGVWRVGTPNATGLGAAVDARRGFVRSAGEGVLAVVLATPCSAPFLGTAVGFALGAGPATILLVFAVLGLGLALPFGLAALVPGLRRRLPRPGPWMTTLEHVLGFALLGTAIWLAWVLVALAGADGVARGLAFALASGAVAFVAGHSRSRRPALVAGLLLLLAAPLALRFTPPPTRAEPAGWEPWSPAAVVAARDAGRTGFVDFTADWCITCKANERLVLADPEVEAALARGARLLADWTRRDDVIRAELRAHGKGGVPLYLVYRPGEAVEVLPELLTKERVLAALAPR